RLRAAAQPGRVPRGRGRVDDRPGTAPERSRLERHRDPRTDRSGRRRIQRPRRSWSRLSRRGLTGTACHEGAAVSSQVVSLVTPGHVPLDLDLPLQRVTGIGPRQAQRLEKLGLTTVRDLLFHLPRRYEDTRATVPLRELQPGIVQTSHVRVRNVSSRRSPYKKMVLVEATLEDDGAVATAVWFNQPFLARQLQPGMELMVSGKVEMSRTGLTFRSPAFERAGPDQHHVGTLAPVYPETQGI